MISSKIDETGKQTPQEIATFLPQGNQSPPMLCGPGRVCGKETKTSKWKIVIMLIVLAVVAIAFIYREIL